MRVVIIDYKMGNVASVNKALASIGASVVVSGEPKDIERATHLVLPGVGAFGDGMRNLRRQGLIPLLRRKVLADKTPFLGICLGMQLLAEKGYEFGMHRGLGWIPGTAAKLKPAGGLRLPHIGWNDITVTKNSALWQKITDFNFYFVHSYHVKCIDAKIVMATCSHGETFAAALQQGNIFATQFHPEKSQASGLQLLKNFLAIPAYA